MNLLRLLRAFVVVLVVLLLATLAGIWVWARPADPDAFYRSVEATAVPGTLLAVRPYTKDVPDGARAWLILYSTTRIDDSPAVASAVVMVADSANGALQPVAWAHGTTGIFPGCAPSVFAPFANVPALPELLAEGWAYVATDYVGLGTEGSHAYLVGDDAARAVLDSIRAATQMQDVEIGSEAVVWGHSQGGNSALWAGIRAPDYAPDIDILGTAAFAPASDLPSLVETAQGGMFGKIVSSYLIAAYAAVYADVSHQTYVGWPSAGLSGDIAGRCVGGLETLVSVAEAALLPAGGIFRTDPRQGALGARLSQNVPKGPYAMPVFIGQGATDDLVLPPVQQAFARQLCDTGVALDFHEYEGRDHVGVVAPDSPLVGDLITWTRARFAGVAPTPNC
ncbi:lipase family protein [Devosia salina]|uniref:Lipase family protein n=1 Tax=Devosia salina TaxID=2860336 RepID=A0ABX8WP90_9HYPH|nr:lipase family protein [Devosia salina]QYO78697.1 lipase family protein [Devosia salina]